MLRQERGERFGRDGAELHLVQRLGKVAILLQRHQHLRQLGIAAPFDKALLELGGLHRGRGVERGGERAVLGDQFRCGLGADPEDAGHIVHRIAHQRQYIADQRGRHAELLLDLGQPDALVLHGVEHVDPRRTVGRLDLANQLHQVLVGADDGHVPPLFLCAAGIGGDQIVRLQPLHLDAGQAEGAGSVADQRELRDKVLRRLGPVGLVVLVDLVAETDPAGIEDHREVGRPVGLVEIGGELPQHRGVAIDCAHRRAFRIGQRRQPVIGAEDVGGTIDEIEVVLFGHAVC